MSVAIDPHSAAPGKANVVLELKFQPSANNSMFDVMPDDNHFLMSITAGLASPTHYNVILNWFTELRRLVPAS